MAIQQTTHVGGGGFTPALKRIDTTASGFPTFLASQKYTMKRGGITLAAALYTADGDGNKIAKAGSPVVKATSGGNVGKYGPYDSVTPATDGRQTPVDDSGYLLEDVNLRDGDVICGLLLEGSVLTARLSLAPDATWKAAVKGRIIFQ